MFDLALLASPARLKREFLATTEVAPQDMPPELEREFAQLREERPDVRMSGAFWLDYIRTYPRHLTALVAGRALITLMILGAVLVSERLLDPEQSLSAALLMLLIFALTQIIMRVINAWTSLLQNQLLVCTRTFVTLRLNAKLLRMGQLATDEFSTGNLKTLISSDIYRISDFLHGISRNGVPCLLGLVLLGPVVVYYMGWPGVIALAVGFAALPLAVVLGRYIHRKEAVIKAEEDKLATIIGEWVSNVRLLRFLSWEPLMRSRVAHHIRRLVTESTKEHAVVLLDFGVSVSWWLFPIIALIWANQVLGHTDDLVTLFASIWMLNHVTLYIRWLPNIFIDYALADACVKRINRLYKHTDIEDELMPPSHRHVHDANPVAIHLEDVGFNYNESTPVLSGLNLSLPLKQRVSVIGRVGCGKSTLLKLLCAEIKPTEGRILVEFDNGDWADLWHRDVYQSVRRSIAYMPQEAYLSNTSLAINVSLDTELEEPDVMRAIQMAELTADIGHWRHGLDEEVGEVGVNLSGGQKQRVNLARALYSERDYLVLDDPLSAVDTDTEAVLMENLIQTATGFLLVSHRLTELTKTDRLLVLEGGRIVEDGSPTALMADETSEFSRQLRAADSELMER